MGWWDILSALRFRSSFLLLIHVLPFPADCLHGSLSASFAPQPAAGSCKNVQLQICLRQWFRWLPILWLQPHTAKGKYLISILYGQCLNVRHTSVILQLCGMCSERVPALRYSLCVLRTVQNDSDLIFHSVPLQRAAGLLPDLYRDCSVLLG